MRLLIGTWCNGNTTVFGAVVLGSNPGAPTISRRGLETVPAQSHKLNYAGSIPAAATKKEFKIRLGRRRYCRSAII